MEISLRKALNLRSKLEAFVADAHDLPLTASLSIFVAENRSDPGAAIEKARGDLLKHIADKINASRILSELRPAIVKANVDNDVESLLAKQAHEERVIALWKVIAGTTVQPVDDAIKGEISVLHRQATDDVPQPGYGGRSITRSANFSVVSEEMREQAKAKVIEAGRHREELSDQRTGANAVAKIRIADDDVAFLREHGFV